MQAGARSGGTMIWDPGLEPRSKCLLCELPSSDLLYGSWSRPGPHLLTFNCPSPWRGWKPRA